MPQFFQFIGVTVCILLGLWLLARIIWGKRWGIHAGLSYFLGWGLKVALTNFLRELEKGKVRKETTADVVANVFWRLTMIGGIGLLIAILPIWLLMQQNGLLTKQNEKIDFQVNLEEATRRSSLVFLIANIEDRIAEELKDNEARELSPELIGRIAALSQSLKPYRYLDGNNLIAKSVSPERAQLFLSLLRSELADTTYQQIFASADFRYADLKESQLNDISAPNANLSGADLSEANLNRANLSGALLHRANLRGAFLIETNLYKAKLYEADLQESYIVGTYFKEADLIKANLTGACLIGADLIEANLDSADLSGADFSGADLSRADFRGADLSRASGINYDSLYRTRSLYKTKGIPDSILLPLKKEKPELFEKPVWYYLREFH